MSMPKTLQPLPFRKGDILHFAYPTGKVFIKVSHIRNCGNHPLAPSTLRKKNIVRGKILVTGISPSNKVASYYLENAIGVVYIAGPLHRALYAVKRFFNKG